MAAQTSPPDRRDRSIIGAVIALCASVSLLPIAFATRDTPRHDRSRSRPLPLPLIEPPSLPSAGASDLERVADDVELAQLFAADQAERREMHDRASWSHAEFAAMAQHDASRRRRVAEMIAAGRIRTGADWWEAGMIEQHGDALDDCARARDYAVQAVLHGDERGLWLAAAAWDRWLIHAGYPQRFGTQGTCDVEAGVRTCHMSPYDPATTDEDRARWDVPPLAELTVCSSACMSGMMKNALFENCCPATDPERCANARLPRSSICQPWERTKSTP